MRLVFTADPGPALVVALSDIRERFRLVANVVDNVELPAPTPKLPVGRAVFQDFAKMSGFQLLTIDENTTVDGFERELHWSVAYCRLAQVL